MKSKSLSPPKSKGTAFPPKPYTEYTIFFRLERTYGLQSSGIIDEEIAASLDPNHKDPLEFPRPAKYQDLKLPPYWYSATHKAAIEKKRKHRKREGRMDMKTLSKTISASWRNADRESIEYCRKLAKAEIKKYNETVEAMVKEQEANAQMSKIQLPNGVISFQDIAVSPAKQMQKRPTVQIAHIMPIPYPPSSMGVSLGGSGVDREDKTLLKMLRLQAAQLNQNNMTACHDALPTLVGPIQQATNNHQTRKAAPKKKRKFLGRASAPPEFKCDGNLQSFMNMNSTVDSTNYNSSNESVSEGSIRPRKQMRRLSSMTSMNNEEEMPAFEQVRRASISSMAPHDLAELKKLRQSTKVSVAAARKEQSDSFQRELDSSNHIFTCVPDWKKEDADALLDVLGDVRAKEPFASIDIQPLAPNNTQEMPNMFMEFLWTWVLPANW